MALSDELSAGEVSIDWFQIRRRLVLQNVSHVWRCIYTYASILVVYSNQCVRIDTAAGGYRPEAAGSDRQPGLGIEPEYGCKQLPVKIQA